METTEKTIMQEFAEFEAKNGPAFVYGHLTAPYDGCFYLNAIAFISGEYAYVAADLDKFPRYSRFVRKSPKATNKFLKAGCILAEDLENVLSGPRSDGLEIHPISELGENTPYAMFEPIIAMAKKLGLDVHGQFKCAACGVDFADVDDGCHYLEGEFKGNGGIGIEVGAPVCYECYSERHCGYCGAEVEPRLNGAFAEEHCQWCAADIKCDCCGEEVKPSREWDMDVVDVDAYNAGQCRECYIQTARAELTLAEYEKTENATGSLFS